MFDNWTSIEMGFLKAITFDIINIFFMVGGYKLAKRAKKKQNEFYEKGGSTDVTWGDTFVWTMSLVIGLIVAWFFPVKFHELLCDLTGFHYRIGMFAKLARFVLVLELLYMVFRAPKIILPAGRVVLMVVMPICLIYGHYFQ